VSKKTPSKSRFDVHEEEEGSKEARDEWLVSLGNGNAYERGNGLVSKGNQTGRLEEKTTGRRNDSLRPRIEQIER